PAADGLVVRHRRDQGGSVRHAGRLADQGPAHGVRDGRRQARMPEDPARRRARVPRAGAEPRALHHVERLRAGRRRAHTSRRPDHRLRLDGGPDHQVTRRFRHLLVAGAAGFIGSNFVRLVRATRPGVQVTVLDRLTYAGNRANLAEFEGAPGYRFVQGDICDADLVDTLAADADAIVNFAAETHVDRSLMDPFAFIETDVRG